jgi:CubicO group peptidase (beta-lactamase class C family)
MLRAWWVVLLGCLGAASRADERGEALRDMLSASHREGLFSGVALVAQRGRVLVEIPLGVAEASGRRALSSRDRFNIGSISKEFSAVVIMRLVEQGRIAPDDPVARYLNDLPGWSSQVTVRMLLDYSSGLPEMRWRDVRSDRDAYEDLRRLQDTTFEPGTAFGYTYNNIMMRQFVAEAVTGRPFAQALRELLGRCGMKDSLVDPPSDAPRVARAFSAASVADVGDMPVSGIAFVTAGDLYRWSRCLRSGRAARMETLMALGNGINPDNGALGKPRWEGMRLQGHEHRGESRNYEALLRFDGYRDSVVVLLGNQKRQRLGDIADAAEAILDGREYGLSAGVARR